MICRSLRLLSPLLGAALALAAGGALAADVTVDTRGSSEYGAYLVDGKGMSLYLFEPDERGRSTCHDACADAWPPATWMRRCWAPSSAVTAPCR